MKREIFMGHLRRNKYRYLIGIGGTGTGCVVYYQMHIQETPLTHRKRFILFNSEQLSEIEKLEKDSV